MHIIIHSSLTLGLSSNVDLSQGCIRQTISLFGFMESFKHEGLKNNMLFVKTSISSKYTNLKNCLLQTCFKFFIVPGATPRSSIPFFSKEHAKRYKVQLIE